MKWFYRALFLFCVAAGPSVPRVWSQEAVDQQGAETTPIPRQGWEHVQSGEGQSEAAATPKPKKKNSGLSGVDNVNEMSPEEFKRMGLDKLSPAELQTLNQWLKGYKHQAETQAAVQATETTREQAKEEGRRQGREEARAEAKKDFNRSWLNTDRIYSRIQGEFHGLGQGGKKIFIVLEDGSVWKQANEMDRVLDPPKWIQDPPVMITHSIAGYKMHVIGAGEFWVNPYRQH